MRTAAALIFTIPLRTNSNANAREHYRARASRVAKEREVTRLAWMASGSTHPTMPSVVTLTRVSPRLLDSGDNLPSAMKAVRDELAAAWGINDRDQCVEWRYAQRRASKTFAVEVEWMSRTAWLTAQIARLQAELGGAA